MAEPVGAQEPMEVEMREASHSPRPRPKDRENADEPLTGFGAE